MKLNKILTIFVFFSMISISYSQTIPIDPLSNQYPQNIELINTLELPSFNNDSLYNIKNHFTDSQVHAQRFAFGIPYKIDLKQNIVNWENHGNNKIFRFRVKSDSALGFKFRFSKFNLPPSANLFFYPIDKYKIYGAFTKLNNRISNTFITQEIPFRDVIIEINISNEDFENLQIEIDQIAYVYQSENFVKLHALQFGLSADECHINVLCAQPNNDWCREVRAVIKLELALRENSNIEIFNDYTRCSGALLNDKNNSFSNYIVTATHCIEDNLPNPLNPLLPEKFNISAFLDDAVVTFNWHSPNCTPTSMGNDNMTLLGLTKRHGAGWIKCTGDWGARCPDLTLLQINQTMRWDYNVYYAGWNMSTTMNDFSNHDIASIHHPFGDVKRFASGIADDRLNELCDKNECWKVAFFQGGVQPGSSGAPLFANDRKVIGVLHMSDDPAEGSSLLCRNFPNNVLATGASYGKLGSAQGPLKAFLAPGFPDEHDLSGIDPFEACIPEIKIFGQLYPGNDYQLKNEIIVQAANKILIADNNIPTLIDGSGIPGNTTNKCNYVFRANDLIRINQNFSIKAGNTMSLRLEPCAPFIDCGFNHQNALVVPTATTNKSNVKYKDFESVNLYPSPTSNVLNLDTKGIAGKNKIIITNSLGQVLYNSINNFEFNFTNTQINTSSYANGIYFLEILNAEGKVINIQKFSVLQ